MTHLLYYNDEMFVIYTEILIFFVLCYFMNFVFAFCIQPSSCVKLCWSPNDLECLGELNDCLHYCSAYGVTDMTDVRGQIPLRKRWVACWSFVYEPLEDNLHQQVYGRLC